MKKKSIWKRILKWIRNLVIFFFASTILTTIAYRWIPVYYTPLMFIRCAQQMFRGEEIRLKHHWVPLEEMSKDLPIAVIASEDQNFEKHHGFDFDAIQQAMKEREKTGRVRGASTISQQTAKNVFLWPSSTWIRKGFEVYFTALIELFWSKERIMEVYLNSIEMGDGIYGAEACAQLHFNTTAARLSRQQCALIAGSLPNPIRFNSSKPSKYLIKRQGQILKQMSHFISFPAPKADESKKGSKKKRKK
ncbi:MAG: monofunctional biosynthetic peptidoglycan transglycosylase [Bacteroidales bacterium]|nr:monofunctional biosynthetic peptidoglycan transglycosylase [Candidatus Minthousia equi]